MCIIMSKCEVCSQTVSRYNDSIMCNNPLCAGIFHIKCTNIGEVQLTDLKISGDIRKWICESCKVSGSAASINGGRGSVVSVAVGDSGSDPEINNVISNKVKLAINTLTEDVINLLRNEIYKMNVNNNRFSDEVDKLQSEVSKLITENNNLKQEVLDLKSYLELCLKDGVVPVKPVETISNEAQQLQPKNLPTKKNINKLASKNTGPQKKVNKNISNADKFVCRSGY